MRKLLLICFFLAGCAKQPLIPDQDTYPYIYGDMATIEIQGAL
jgi:hypothetical protein